MQGEGLIAAPKLGRRLQYFAAVGLFLDFPDCIFHNQDGKQMTSHRGIAWKVGEEIPCGVKL